MKTQSGSNGKSCHKVSICNCWLGLLLSLQPPFFTNNLDLNYVNEKLQLIYYSKYSQNGLLRSPSSPFGVPSHRTIQPQKLQMWNFVSLIQRVIFFCLIQRVNFTYWYEIGCNAVTFFLCNFLIFFCQISYKSSLVTIFQVSLRLVEGLQRKSWKKVTLKSTLGYYYIDISYFHVQVSKYLRTYQTIWLHLPRSR